MTGLHTRRPIRVHIDLNPATGGADIYIVDHGPGVEVGSDEDTVGRGPFAMRLGPERVNPSDDTSAPHVRWQPYQSHSRTEPTLVLSSRVSVDVLQAFAIELARNGYGVPDPNGKLAEAKEHIATLETQVGMQDRHAERAQELVLTVLSKMAGEGGPE